MWISETLIQILTYNYKTKYIKIMTYAEFQDISDVLINARIKAIKENKKDVANSIMTMEDILASIPKVDRPMSQYHNENKFGK